MNTKQFMILFLNVALLGMANAIFFGTGAATAGTSLINLNGALTLPLASATAGTLATPLAVLGALKLGAVALLALGLLGNDDDGYEVRWAQIKITVESCYRDHPVVLTSGLHFTRRMLSLNNIALISNFA